MFNALFDLIVNDQFNPILRMVFGWEEDSAVVSLLMNLL